MLACHYLRCVNQGFSNFFVQQPHFKREFLCDPLMDSSESKR